MKTGGGKVETVSDFIFLGSQITADSNCSHEIKRRLPLRRKAMTNLDSVLKSRDIALPTKGPYSQSYGFSSSHIWMWELNHKEGWVPKNWCFPTVVLEKTLESPLGSKEIKPVNPKWNQPWIITGKTDAEALILLPPDAKSRLTHWKRPFCWERLRAGRERGERGWDGWVASLAQWTWVRANSGS